MPARRRTPPALDRILGATSRVRLLRVFCAADGALTGRAAAREAGVAHRASVLALAALVESGIVSVERHAAANAYVLNARHPLAKRIGRLFEREAN
jgi:hypothetical protein